MKPFLKNLPDAPGVYLMKNEAGEVIYIGKALSLKKRVRSYFMKRSGREMRPAERYLSSRVHDVEFIATRNETEAFILENNLIKKQKPVYNIRLKDDKTFLSLRIDMKHAFPSIVPVRRPKRDGCLYFGPYSSSRALRSTLRTIRTIIPLRDCSDREFKNRTRPCIKHQIGRCPAPCVGLIDGDAYREHLDRALAILRGKVEKILVEFEEAMGEAAQAMEFEKAARLRDQIGYLKTFSRSQKVEVAKFYDVDVIGTHESEGMTEVVVLFFREGKLLSSRAYTFDLQVDETELISQFLVRFYDGKRYVPEETLIPVKVPDMKAVAAFLQDQRKAAFRLRVASRGDAAKLMQLARENARLTLRASQAALQHAARLQENLRQSLGLRKAPITIEGVDISTTGGGEAVGSVVHFKNGASLTSRYRKYKIKTVEGMDDFAMLKEVVLRRLKRGVKENTLPDLILVDGGLGQLNSALAAAGELGLTSVDFLGIQKGETRARAVHIEQGVDDRIVVPGQGVTARIASGSPELHLLQKIRDEAHRFAITYHRKRRSKAGLSSPLDKVKGLGPAKKQNLLKRFGGLKGLKAASRDELTQAKGLGKTLAARVYKTLHD